MSTILVTGASGFVGSWTLPALLDAGHRIVALVRTASAGDLVLERLPAAWRDRVEPRIGDVTKPPTVAAALAGTTRCSISPRSRAITGAARTSG